MGSSNSGTSVGTRPLRATTRPRSRAIRAARGAHGAPPCRGSVVAFGVQRVRPRQHGVDLLAQPVEHPRSPSSLSGPHRPPMIARPSAVATNWRARTHVRGAQAAGSSEASSSAASTVAGSGSSWRKSMAGSEPSSRPRANRPATLPGSPQGRLGAMMRIWRLTKGAVAMRTSGRARGLSVGFGLVGLLVGFGVLTAGTGGSSPGARATAAASGSTRVGWSSVPLAARAPVSAALGSDGRGYRMHGEDGGFHAVSSQQGLRAWFGRAGARISSGGAVVGLRLTGIGYGRSLSPVSPVAPSAAGNRITYPRGRERVVLERAARDRAGVHDPQPAGA